MLAWIVIFHEEEITSYYASKGSFSPTNNKEACDFLTFFLLLCIYSVFYYTEIIRMSKPNINMIISAFMSQWHTTQQLSATLKKAPSQLLFVRSNISIYHLDSISFVMMIAFSETTVIYIFFNFQDNLFLSFRFLDDLHSWKSTCIMCNQCMKCLFLSLFNNQRGCWYLFLSGLQDVWLYSTK